MTVSTAELELEEVLNNISGHISVCSFGCQSILITDRGRLNPQDGTLECPICGGLLFDYATMVKKRDAVIHI